ncbi:uncharacterized protein LOC111704908 [Eurytemora carolleeae]|uniref:uncharacterized protein LOC111704908 n=1 Tax=Eurytemora carolleeae TaxID=1294199 RepID=UPI000C774D42|nr:uncharacterized protein LOC111704908 [Eurytemora carolleeae]|eukprot:XP_023333066.1 uncharacterized protein LOC111704908 [Eurytemora affinis]
MCLSFDLENGEVKLFENGEQSHTNKHDLLINLHQRFSNSFQMASPGCAWRPIFSGYMSMYGKVTDMQIFSRILTDEEMMEITGCKVSMQGDVISWENTAWMLVGRKQISEREVVDFETTVCKMSTTSLIFIPVKLTYIPGTENMCRKMSGHPAAFQTQEEFRDLIIFINDQRILNSVCSTQLLDSNKSEFRAWVGINDLIEEGIWRNSFTGEQVNYLNWLPNRPFTGGEKYNCMELVAETITTNSSISLISEGKVADSECSYTSCPVCRLEQTVRKVSVRGLCANSLFNIMYLYNLDSEGSILYLGIYSSFVTFDKASIII